MPWSRAMTKPVAPSQRPRRRKEAEERPRARRARPVAELVPDVGRAAFRRFGFVQSSVVSRWPEIVGARHARVSSPESIRFPPGRKSGGVLTLVVAGAHAPMMQHVAPLIMERVNLFFGYEAVARIVFRQGALPERRRPSAHAAPAPVPDALGDSLRAVADPELRACLESLARGLGARDSAPVTAIPVVGKIGDRRS